MGTGYIGVQLHWARDPHPKGLHTKPQPSGVEAHWPVTEVALQAYDAGVGLEGGLHPFLKESLLPSLVRDHSGH